MNKNRYKSSVNKVYYVFLIIYNIITLLLLTSKIFVTTNIALLGGLLFLVIDIFILLPQFFLTDYEFCDEYLKITDWPWHVYKIRYADMFDIKDGSYKAARRRKVALSLNTIAIGYQAKSIIENKDVNIYIYVSPDDTKNFLAELTKRVRGINEKSSSFTQSIDENSGKPVIVLLNSIIKIYSVIAGFFVKLYRKILKKPAIDDRVDNNTDITKQLDKFTKLEEKKDEEKIEVKSKNKEIEKVKVYEAEKSNKIQNKDVSKEMVSEHNKAIIIKKMEDNEEKIIINNNINEKFSIFKSIEDEEKNPE